MKSMKSKGTVLMESTEQKSKVEIPRSEATLEAVLWSSRLRHR